MHYRAGASQCTSLMYVPTRAGPCQKLSSSSSFCVCVLFLMAAVVVVVVVVHDGCEGDEKAW